MLGLQCSVVQKLTSTKYLLICSYSQGEKAPHITFLFKQNITNTRKKIGRDLKELFFQ